MPSQSSQFSSAIHTHSVKEKWKKNIVTKKLRKEKFINYWKPSTPLESRNFTTTDTSSKQINKRTSAPIIKYSEEGSTLRLSRDTRAKEKEVLLLLKDIKNHLGRRSCRFKAGKSPSTLKPPRNRDISRIVWIVWYLYKAWSIGAG